jgi:hypothetical protein
MAGDGTFTSRLDQPEAQILRPTLNEYRSQSRMKGEYLFYEEKVETTEEEKQAKAARR